jgi:hypothetical protein
MAFTKANAAESGRKGGRRTFERHGATHMRAIGREGFRATCERHYGGDKRAMLKT